MKQNAELTVLLRGRAVASIEEEQTTVTVTFQDAWVMRIHAEAKIASGIEKFSKISQVLDEDSGMEIRFEGGGQLVLRLANAGNSVSVRDAANEVVYLG
ncbi:MAG: hypothetical protein JOY92_11095 [Verrucomicrobia bacterium]|jgi:hypothetical protein|nr:hypothetical protein [Verrucomicrobiota bacterium]